MKKRRVALVMGLFVLPYLIPLPAGEKLHADIQGSELAIFPQSGHLPTEEQAAALNARLIEFLRQ